MLERGSIKNYIPLTVPLYNLRDANTTIRSRLCYIRKQHLFIKKLGTETFAICPIHHQTPLSFIQKALKLQKRMFIQNWRILQNSWRFKGTEKDESEINRTRSVSCLVTKNVTFLFSISSSNVEQFLLLQQWKMWTVKFLLDVWYLPPCWV